MFYSVVKLLQPFLVPLCFVTAWALVFLVGWSLWAFLRDSLNRAEEMHQIPCAHCRFFTGDYHLKCTVHPSTALSEAAIGCQDFTPPPR